MPCLCPDKASRLLSPLHLDELEFRLRLLPGRGLTAVVPASAHAQIYAWRDGVGNLVLSNAGKAAGAQTYAVAERPPTAFRTTRRPVSRRAAEFEPLIVEHSTSHNVNPDLVRAVIQAESAFNPRARSHKGAMGLMQLMPATAAEYSASRRVRSRAEHPRRGRLSQEPADSASRTTRSSRSPPTMPAPAR